MGEKIHLVYCSDTNYLEPTLVSAASAAVWASEEHPQVVHVVTDRVPDERFEAFERRLKNVSLHVEVVRHVWETHAFDSCPEWHGSRIIYARLTLEELLPDENWAISLDGDTLWLGDPWELLKLRDDSLWFQSSIDPPAPDGAPNPQFGWYRERGLEMREEAYFCVGLMILNLKALRACSFGKQCCDFLKRYPDPAYPEQMVMCYLAQGHSAALPPQWGVYSVLHCGTDLTQPGLIHYVQDGPWRRDKLNRLFSDVVLLWFAFVKTVLGADRHRRDFSWFTRLWRRGFFRLLKACPWLLFHPILKRKFRNTAGIPEDMFKTVVDRWAALRRQA